MSESNWHVPLNKFSDEQRKVIERVYGSMQININRYFGFYNGLVLFADVKDSLGKEITPDEAFAILGLDGLLDTDLVTVKNLKVQNKALHQELAELEQQLAEQPEQGLQGVDWSIVEKEYDVVVQKKDTGAIRVLASSDGGVKTGRYTILATRPKPKVKPPLTDEQIEAVFMFVDEVKDSGQLSGADTLWLNEFACEIKERKQTGGEL